MQASLRSSRLTFADDSHHHHFQFAGVHHRTLVNLPDGTFSLTEAASKVRGTDPQGHLATTRLVCIENTHCNRGGKALPLDWLDEVGF